jgi:hypothetical protein
MYRMYLDEHGVDQMTRLDVDTNRYLSLTGVVMRVDHARDYLEVALNSLKADVLNRDPDAPLCLHRKDIMQCKGPFECLKDKAKRAAFDDRLMRILLDCEYTVITVLLDKQELTQKHHWARTHPYHVLLEVIVEKFTLLLSRKGSVGDVMPEARGKHQDAALQNEFETFRRKGTRFVPSATIQARIPSQNLKFRTKKDDIAGLQVCDLLAHPAHYTIRHSLNHKVEFGAFGERVSELLVKSKFDRSVNGSIWGYGAKHLP